LLVGAHGDIEKLHRKYSIKKEGTPASFRLLQRLIDYGIATGYLRGRTVQRTSG